MNTRRQISALALFGWMLVLVLLTMPETTAQINDDLHRGAITVQRAIRSAAATRVAHERYAFVERFLSKSETVPLTANAEDSYSTVLFPLGRSDRAYVCFPPAPWRGTMIYRVFCYQRKDGNDTLIYQVHLKRTERRAANGEPAKRASKIASLLDFLSTERATEENGVEHTYGYAITGRLIRFAKADLAAKREYVEYGYRFGVDTLQVSLLSDNKNGYPTEKGDWYFLEENPLTKTKWTSGEQFYEKYGLPVASRELALFADASN